MPTVFLAGVGYCMSTSRALGKTILALVKYYICEYMLAAQLY